MLRQQIQGLLLVLAACAALVVALADGLRPDTFFVGVMRDAMSADQHDPAGLYFGGRNGAVFASADEGETWREITANLPDVMVVRAAAV